MACVTDALISSTCWILGILYSHNAVNYLLVPHIVHRNKPHRIKQLRAHLAPLRTHALLAVVRGQRAEAPGVIVYIQPLEFVCTSLIYFCHTAAFNPLLFFSCDLKQLRIYL